MIKKLHCREHKQGCEHHKPVITGRKPKNFCAELVEGAGLREKLCCAHLSWKQRACNSKHKEPYIVLFRFHVFFIIFSDYKSCEKFQGNRLLPLFSQKKEIAPRGFEQVFRKYLRQKDKCHIRFAKWHGNSRDVSVLCCIPLKKQSIAPRGFEPRSQGPEPCMIGHYTTGLFAGLPSAVLWKLYKNLSKTYSFLCPE